MEKTFRTTIIVQINLHRLHEIKDHLFQTLVFRNQEQKTESNIHPATYSLNLVYLIFTIFRVIQSTTTSHPTLEGLFFGWYCVIFDLERYIITTVSTVILHVEMLLLCVFPHLSLQHIFVANPFPWRKTVWPFTEKNGTWWTSDSKLLLLTRCKIASMEVIKGSIGYIGNLKHTSWNIKLLLLLPSSGAPQQGWHMPWTLL